MNAFDASLARVMVGGVLLAAVLIATGLLALAVAHVEPPGDRIFRGEPSYLRSPVAIARHALDFGAPGERRALVQLGVLLLLLSPFVRVAFACAHFVAERSAFYAVVSAVVLAILTASFFF